MNNQETKNKIISEMRKHDIDKVEYIGDRKNIQSREYHERIFIELEKELKILNEK
jgi:hypothetical protein